MKKNLYRIFFIVGAQRSGTTYLYKMLDEHPEICMAKPVKPEPRFFLGDEFLKGRDYYERTYYTHANENTKVLGEKSTSYYENRFVAGRLKATYPDGKIIFILRNPIYRAISNYFFSVKNGLETRSLSDVFISHLPAPPCAKTISTDPFNYLGRGEYLKHIEKFSGCFSRENLHVIIFERFVNNLQEVQALYHYLGVQEEYIPKCLNRKFNQSDIVPSYVYQRIVMELNKYFRPQIAQLEHFLGMNLHEWK